MARYIVDRSSYFDSHPYPEKKIEAAVKRAGGENIRYIRNHGWSNQPRVVAFSLAAAYVHRVYDAVSKAVGTPWITIRPKTW